MPPRDASSPGADSSNDWQSLQQTRPSARQLELARREQEAMLAAGQTIELDDLLERTGFAATKRAKSPDRSDKADAQTLRLHIPPARQNALGIFLLGLEDGILRIAASGPLPTAERDLLLEILRRGRLDVVDIDIESWDRAQMARLLRDQEEISSERLLTTFAKLEREPDNALNVERAVSDIVAEALQLRASDIHLWAHAEVAKCWIAYRIDGDLSFRHLLPPAVMAPIATRIKTDARMDSAERRRPQDGRFSYSWQGRIIDIRAATLPIMPAGEKLTLRLLDAANLRSFGELFRGAVPLGKRIKTKLQSQTKDGGLIVVSGPTGSGKSTTLYAMVQSVDRSGKAVYEVAQPVEYEQHLVSQVPINEGSSLRMEDAIRAFLRHDPDVVVVGEVRDSETVEAAIRIAESGHMVLTTVHANTAEGTLDRIYGFLSDSYRQPGLYALGQYFTAVLNQRLVKTLCPGCKERAPAGAALKKFCAPLGIHPDAEVGIASPNGCELCNRTGFLGRELLLEGIFAPDSAAERRVMTARIMEKGLASVATAPGSLVHRRHDSIRSMLARGVLDADSAIRLLIDLEGDETIVAEAPPGARPT